MTGHITPVETNRWFVLVRNRSTFIWSWLLLWRRFFFCYEIPIITTCGFLCKDFLEDLQQHCPQSIYLSIYPSIHPTNQTFPKSQSQQVLVRGFLQYFNQKRKAQSFSLTYKSKPYLRAFKGLIVIPFWANSPYPAVLVLPSKNDPSLCWICAGYRFIDFRNSIILALFWALYLCSQPKHFGEKSIWKIRGSRRLKNISE